jgi:Dual specificity phosphatase, catalytic domain
MLRTEFNKNFTNIKKLLKTKQTKSKDASSTYDSSLDLREKYLLFKQKEMTAQKSDSMNNFINSIKKVAEESQNHPIAKLHRSSIFDSYLSLDEPVRQNLESCISKIPYKEYLTVIGNHGNLYISDVRSGCNLSLLKSADIRAILSIGSSQNINKFNFISGGYLNLPIEENHKSILNFKENLAKATRFIDAKLKEGNVLVCCYYGVCRSCALVIYYLMKKYMIKLEKALTIVKYGRKSCALSKSAMRILKDLESDLFNLN